MSIVYICPAFFSALLGDFKRLRHIAMLGVQSAQAFNLVKRTRRRGEPTDDLASVAQKKRALACYHQGFNGY